MPNKFKKIKSWMLIIAFLVVISPFNNDFAYSKTYNYIYYYNTGVNFQNKGKYALAIKNYQKALSLNAKYSKARTNMMYAYISIANEYGQNKKYIQAIPNYKKAISLNPNIAELHFNLGIAYYNIGKTDLAIKSYEKALKLKSTLYEAKNNLSALYFNQGIKLGNSSLYDNAIQCYKKCLEYDPAYANAYYNLGVCYSLLGRYEEATLSYQKALDIDPNLTSANNNLEILLKKKEEKELSSKINNLIPEQKAPVKIYRLVRLNKGVNPIAKEKLDEIFDFIWNDPEGQKLLSIIMNNDIPVNITQGSSETNANVSIKTYRNVVTYAGVPIMTYNTGRTKEITVNIGEDHILAFKNPGFNTSKRIYSFHVVIHELCHAVDDIISKNSDNAIIEEITASMIGYNVASRILKGRNLTEKEAEEYAQNCMKAITKDDHKFLPVYNNFINEIQQCGIYPPYPYLYQNIAQLYQSVKNDPETQKVDTLERTIWN